MTKREFKNYIENELGYKSYKDYLEELGYSRRYLDRVKLGEDIPTGLKNKIGKETKSEAQKKEPQKDVKKVEKIKEVKKETPPPETKEQKSDGVGLIIPNSTYHSDKRLSASKLKLILENAREYYLRYVTGEIEQKDTDALLIGSLHHTLVLEPEMLEKEYLILDLPKKPIKEDFVNALEKLGGELNTKTNGKGEVVVSDTVQQLREKIEELKAKSNKTIVTQAQVDIARETAEKALNSYFVVEVGIKELFRAKLRDLIALKDRCYVERTFYGVIDGVEIQIRPDLLVNLSQKGNAWFVVDLKTAQDATLQTFMKQSASYYYDVQEYVYREILRQNGIDVKDFRFCVAGKSEGSQCAYYQLHPEEIENAEKIVKKIIQKYKYCLENDDWQEGYFDYHRMRFEPNTVVQLPTWRQFELVKMGVL